MRKKKQYDDDDGRVISPMNVEGMPWYVNQKDKKPEDGEKVNLSREESRVFGRAVAIAALLVCAVFVLGFLAVILFADLVWLQ